MKSRVLRIRLQLRVSAAFISALLVPTAVAAAHAPLDLCKGLQPHNVTVDCVLYRGARQFVCGRCPVRMRPITHRSRGLVAASCFSRDRHSITVLSMSMLQGYRRRMRLPLRAGLLGSRSACRRMLPGMTMSTYVRRTGAPTIRNAETTQRNTPHSPTTNG